MAGCTSDVFVDKDLAILAFQQAKNKLMDKKDCNLSVNACNCIHKMISADSKKKEQTITKL